jgi:ABC-type multidrug transport system ATPase subunit
VPTAALEIATAVGLGSPDVYTRQSGKLSGGMRRRLSIAVSLLGSPKVVNLDEPSTGLDPSTRHEIWSLVSSFASPKRAVIITTHTMIEADTLCSRIAIVSKGKLKVVGDQQHLKVRIFNHADLVYICVSHSISSSCSTRRIITDLDICYR